MNSWMGSRVMETMFQQTGYRTFVRDSELAAAGPASLWMMIDEHERSIDEGWFGILMNTSTPFADLPADRHQNGYCISMADGHAQSMKRRGAESQRTIPISGQRNKPGAGFDDWLVLKEISTVR
jgi:hypothetical protein